MYIRRGKSRPAKRVLTSELTHLASGATSIPSQPVENEHSDLYCDLELTLASTGAPLTGEVSIEFIDAETGQRLSRLERSLIGRSMVFPDVSLPRGVFKLRVGYEGNQPLGDGNELKVHSYPLEIADKL